MNSIEKFKHYNEIITSEFMDDDVFSTKLVNYYKDYIDCLDMNNNDIKIKGEKLDRAIYKYIDDYAFSKKLCSTLDTDAILSDNFKKYIDQFFDYIINFSIEYDENLETFISQTRWI